MDRKLILVGLALVSGFICVGALLGLVSHQAWAMPAVFITRQVGGDGLGDPGNYQIPSSAVFGDYLYAGTWHTDWITKTAQIWRTSNGVNWVKVDDRPMDGAAALIAFKGSLYAGSWVGAKVWSSPDGLNWTDIITDGFGTPTQAIARFMVFNDHLYASTWNGDTGTEVWRSENGTDWVNYIDEGLHHNPDNSSVIASEIFNGFLYLGVVNDVTGAQLWRTDGITTTAVITDGFGITQNQAVSALAMFSDMLYASTYNLNGVQVWRSTNGTDWAPIVFNFDNPNTSQESAMQVFDDQLYLAFANYITGMEVWRTSTGTAWERVATGGFGDANNHFPYWDNGLTVFKDKLYVGVTNWQTGGEIWQMSTQPNKTFMPTILKPCPPAFQDNFSNPSSGWPIVSETYYSMNYLNGEYQITVNPGWFAWSMQNFGVTDYRVQVDEREAIDTDGGLGVIFAATDEGFYLFEISDDWYGLWRNDTDPWDWTTLIDWTQSPIIHPGLQTNHMEVVRMGDNITIYANGQMLGSASDGTYHGTWVGMSDESYSSYMDGRFDNFALYTGGCIAAQKAALPLNQPAPYGATWMEQRPGITRP